MFLTDEFIKSVPFSLHNDREICEDFYKQIYESQKPRQKVLDSFNDFEKSQS